VGEITLSKAGHCSGRGRAQAGMRHFNANVHGAGWVANAAIGITADGLAQVE
jgi:hypothetical protein